MHTVCIYYMSCNGNCYIKNTVIVSSVSVSDKYEQAAECSWLQLCLHVWRACAWGCSSSDWHTILCPWCVSGPFCTNMDCISCRHPKGRVAQWRFEKTEITEPVPKEMLSSESRCKGGIEPATSWSAVTCFNHLAVPFFWVKEIKFASTQLCFCI